MSTDKPAPLAPLDERTIEFHGDRLTAVLAPGPDGQPTIYVPVRPLADYLGLTWPAQTERIRRDAVLSAVVMFVRVTRTHIPSSRARRTQDMLALPVEFLHGWLFGVDVSRVKPELRERLTLYRREAFGVLWRAFNAGALGTAPEAPTVGASPLAHVRSMALAVAALAEQQIALEGRVGSTEDRLDRAALVVGDVGRRLAAVERKLSGGAVVTEDQAAEVSQAVKALAALLTDDAAGGRNPYQAVFGELYRRFGVSSYKNIRADQFAAVLAWLEDWRRRVAGDAVP